MGKTPKGKTTMKTIVLWAEDEASGETLYLHATVKDLSDESIEAAIEAAKNRNPEYTISGWDEDA